MAKMIYLGHRVEIYIPSLSIKSVIPGVPFDVPDESVQGLLKNEGFEVFVEKVLNEEASEAKPARKARAKAADRFEKEPE